MKVKTSRREGHQHVIELPDNIGGGDSAYQVAVNNGFVGTEAEWLASLEGSDGVDGEDGADGASAYAIALANGFVGTQAEWLASLEGADGIDGEDGADGAGAWGDITGTLSDQTDLQAALDSKPGLDDQNIRPEMLAATNAPEPGFTLAYDSPGLFRWVDPDPPDLLNMKPFTDANLNLITKE